MADAIKDGPPENPQDEVSASGGGSSKKKLIIIGAIIVLQTVIMLFAGEFVIKPMFVEGSGEGIDTEETTGDRGLILVLDNIIVNLNGPEATRFLKLSVGLEVEHEKMATEVEERRPELRDIVISSVSGKRVDEIVTAEDKDVLRAQLRNSFSDRLQSGQLLNVYFSEFVVQ